MIEIDTSTINRDELRKLPVYEGNYKISGSMGQACLLDPPGYPSYFIRAIYNSFGNSPSGGPVATVLGRVVESADEDYGVRVDRIAKLWNPLSEDHPRVDAWIESLYTYFHNCYVDDSKENATHASNLIIYPVPSYQFVHAHAPYGMKRYYDASRELRMKRQEAVDRINEEIEDKARSVAIPENHAAHRYATKFYPNMNPRIDLIKNPVKEMLTWWEVLSEKPAPEECPGEIGWGITGKHPVGKTWCQVCGWRK